MGAVTGFKSYFDLVVVGVVFLQSPMLRSVSLVRKSLSSLLLSPIKVQCQVFSSKQARCHEKGIAYWNQDIWLQIKLERKRNTDRISRSDECPYVE